MNFNDLKSKAMNLAADSNAFKDLKEKANALKSGNVVDSISEVVKKSKEGGDAILNVKDGVIGDLAKATSSAYNTISSVEDKNPKNIVEALQSENVVDSISGALSDAVKKTKEGGDVIINVKDGVIGDLAKATTSAYSTITGSIENAKNLSPEKMVSSIFNKIWKEDKEIFGITISRDQEIYCSIAFLIAGVLFLGMDTSLLFIAHEFENLKYAILFSIWTICCLLGIIVLDRAMPDQLFEKKSKSVRIFAVLINIITLINCVVIAIFNDNWTISVAAFVVHFVSLAWLITTHVPSFKGLNLSLFNEKTPLIFSNFYNSVEN